MSLPNIVRRTGAAAFICAVMLLSGAAAAAEESLTPGSVHIISPSDLTCLTSQTVVNEGPQMTIREGCTGPRAHLFMASGTTVLPDTINVQANAKLAVQFRIDEGTGTNAGSWVPIHVAIPVSWIGRAFNDNLAPSDIVAYLNVNSFARLREGDPGNIGVVGGLISEVPFQGLTHGGPDGCLSVPKGKISAATTAVKCLAGASMKDEGASHVDIAAIVQAGKTYNIEVELIGELFAFNTGPVLGPGTLLLVGHPQINFESSVSGDPFGVTVGDIRVTVGTSVAGELQDLQDQIDRLRQALENHTHEYLTGRGVGHNNTVASTGAAVISDSSSSSASTTGPPAPPAPSGNSGGGSVPGGSGGSTPKGLPSR